MFQTTNQIGSMVLLYLPTKLGGFVRATAGKYSMHGAYRIEHHRAKNKSPELNLELYWTIIIPHNPQYIVIYWVI